MWRPHSEKLLTEPNICSGESVTWTVFSALERSGSTMTSKSATRVWLLRMCRMPSMVSPSKLSQNSRRHKPGEREMAGLVGARRIFQTKWILHYLLHDKLPTPHTHISKLINKSISYLLLSVCWDPKAVQLQGSSGSVLLRKLKANRWPKENLLPSWLGPQLESSGPHRLLASDFSVLSNEESSWHTASFS